jgi:NTE family protein
VRPANRNDLALARPAQPHSESKRLPSNDLGLVLTGGGARSAYQAGALLAVSEITASAELPFGLLSGSSAGSLNATYLASRADDFRGAARALADLWALLTSERIFRTNALLLAKPAAERLADLGLGA